MKKRTPHKKSTGTIYFSLISYEMFQLKLIWWSSFRAHAWGRTDDVIQDHALYRALGATPSARQATYRAFVQTCLDDAELTRIRAASQQDLPLGNDRFRAEIEAALGRRLGYAQRGRPRKPPHVNEPMCAYGI